MPRNKKNISAVKSNGATISKKVSVLSSVNSSLLSRIQEQMENNQAYLSLVLGLIIVIVVGALVFSYLKRTQPTVEPNQQSASTQQPVKQADATPQNLPGKYTVKDGDTLFQIAQYYYGDGYQYPKLATTNKLANANVLEVGQVLDIPKLAVENNQSTVATDTTIGTGTGGATNETIWGDKITTDTYTVQKGDWLSTIAGRAYGDIYSFDKIAKANNISNPDVIEPGTVLKIPR